MSKLFHYKTKAEAQAYIEGYRDGCREMRQVTAKAEREFKDYAEPELFMEKK